jgi:ADP-ribose pyrophosphatase
MKTVYSNPWFKVIKDKKYHYIKENGSNNGAVILAINGDNFIFVKVKRAAHSLELIEAPRGYGEVGETSEGCALREFHEETGYKIKLQNITKLGEVRPNSAILTSSITVFLASVSDDQNISTHDSEISELIYIPVKDIHKAISEGLITDGFTLSALAMFWSSVSHLNSIK